jgi:hypothetical protein
MKASEDAAVIKRLTALQKGIYPEAVPAKPRAIEGVEPASLGGLEIRPGY